MSQTWTLTRCVSCPYGWRRPARAAAVLHWLVPAHRQVRVAGPVEWVSQDEAEEYWSTRAAAVRLSAAASRQSRVVERLSP